MLKNITGLLVAGLLLTFLWGATPVEAFTWNNNTDTSVIYYYYYDESLVQMPPLTETKSAYSGNTASYTVKWGDSLWLISQKLGVSINSLRTANNLWNDNLYPGEVLYYVKSTNQSSSGTTAQKAFTQSDIDLMARVVYAESRGEPYKGQVAVAAVIINRLKHPAFPKTLYEVVF